MGRRREPLRFVCRACGEQRETHNAGNRGIYCDKACRADYERKGRREPTRYQQGGYWMLRWNVGGRYVHQFEHRAVWEQHNGTIPSDGDWIVHHLNGNKLDNRIENLQLMRRADHTSHHHLGRRKVA